PTQRRQTLLSTGLPALSGTTSPAVWRNCDDLGQSRRWRPPGRPHPAAAAPLAGNRAIPGRERRRHTSPTRPWIPQPDRNRTSLVRAGGGARKPFVDRAPVRFAGRESPATDLGRASTSGSSSAATTSRPQWRE